MRRLRKAKIVATLGPSSNTAENVELLFKAGVDVFRLNFSHATHEDHRRVYDIIRQVEEKYAHPIAVLADLQGPKLRIGKFANQKIHLITGQDFQFDQDDLLGNENRVQLPHPEIFKALQVGVDVLLDDGKIRLRVKKVSDDCIQTVVINGGSLSNNKGLNVPSVQLPISALSLKDREDLEFSLGLGVDWVALSFVQRPEDIIEARALIKGRARLLAKIEKPGAIDFLDEIITLSDAIMVARGDLGVEMSPEDVPSIQKRIIRSCRSLGRPVIVATQMLDSMISAPAPTRAEASDVATAVYDGVDAVMLSAESASGEYPVEAVSMMNRIICQVENDPFYLTMISTSRSDPQHNVNDALTTAARVVAAVIPIKAIVNFTESGGTALREARERPEASLIGLTPNLSTARMLNLVWGTHPVLSRTIANFEDMVHIGCAAVKKEGVAEPGDQIVVIAGVPFGGRGGTNILHVVDIKAD